MKGSYPMRTNVV